MVQAALDLGAALGGFGWSEALGAGLRALDLGSGFGSWLSSAHSGAPVVAEAISAPDWLFDNFLFRPWPGAIFQQRVWRAFCLALAIGLAFVTAILFMLERRARRIGRAPKEKVCRAIGLILTVVSFLLYFDFFNPNTRYQHYYHRHELYHYYLGSKYFDEIGYERLYECTAVAEVELFGKERMRTREMRDLSAENLTHPVPETVVFSDPGHCKRHFTGERWALFKADVRWFEASARGNYWERMLTDHGYNPPPVWTMTGQFFANLAPAGDHFFKLLALLDIGLQAGALGMLGWAFGWRTMTLAAVFWGCNAPANMYWTGGAFLRQDWVFLLVSSVCLARKRRFVLSGAALTWSGLLRVFPIAYFGGVGLVMLFSLLRERRVKPDHLRFLAGCVLSAGLLVPLSIRATSADAYPAFVEHIGLHKDTPLSNQMGLGVMLVHDWDGRMVFTQDNRLDDTVEPWKDGRARRRAAMRPVFWAINALLLAWLAWALSRVRHLWIGIALTTPIIPALSNVTCYYFSMFLVVAALVRARPALGPAYLALAGASQVLLHRFYWIDDKYTALSYLFFAFGACLLTAFSRQPKWLRAWLSQRKPGSRALEHRAA